MNLEQNIVSEIQPTKVRTSFHCDNEEYHVLMSVGKESERLDETQIDELIHDLVKMKHHIAISKLPSHMNKGIVSRLFSFNS
jgi:hypothetical protein